VKGEQSFRSFGFKDGKGNNTPTNVELLYLGNSKKQVLTTFNELGLGEELLQGLDAMGFKKATPIQEQAIPVILNKGDLIACAQTGTGKTAAFTLPVLQRLMENRRDDNSIRGLIIVPTRELALQIDQSVMGLSYFADVSSFALYGGGDGADFNQQKQALSMGTDLVIATPGKLISHLNMGYMNLKNLEFLILDEADRMLDMGFVDDLMRIVSFLPKERQNLMFSATMPKKIRELAKSILTDPKEITLALSKPAEGVIQVAYLVYPDDKQKLVTKLLDKEGLEGVLIFSRTKNSVKQIARKLRSTPHHIEEMHSDLEQSEREEVMRKFKAKKVQVLVATDIVSRGIDVKELKLVINFDVPDEAEDYVHRVGRTARADSTGMAITFVSPDEQRKFSRIEALIGNEIMKQPVPEDVGNSFQFNPNAGGGRNKKPFRGKKKRFGNKGRKPRKD
jgi:superfamily II DNA/RNA helicase